MKPSIDVIVYRLISSKYHKIENVNLGSGSPEEAADNCLKFSREAFDEDGKVDKDLLFMLQARDSKICLCVGKPSDSLKTLEWVV